MIPIGGLAPLSRPGWVEAGRHLLAGLELGVHDVNEAGGVAGSRLSLAVRDTGADPLRAAAAVDELAEAGVVAIAGEYHSVAARAAAARADYHRLPFVCSSAVLDALTDEPTDWVARLCPAQSHGWRVYADFLLGAGHRTVAAATQKSVYWAAGVDALRRHLAPGGVSVAEFDMARLTASQLRDGLVDCGATALLLLVGHPEPAVPIVRSVRSDPRLTHLMIGAPAGQPELPEWAALLGANGAGIPFLRYLPDRLGPRGERVESFLRGRLPGSPSFVALEGYDAILVLAEALRSRTANPADLWPRIAVDGTRGTIRFSRTPDVSVWQWTWAPVQVAERDPERPDRFHTLYAG